LVLCWGSYWVPRGENFARAPRHAFSVPYWVPQGGSQSHAQQGQTHAGHKFPRARSRARAPQSARQVVVLASVVLGYLFGTVAPSCPVWLPAVLSLPRSPASACLLVVRRSPGRGAAPPPGPSVCRAARPRLLTPVTPRCSAARCLPLPPLGLPSAPASVGLRWAQAATRRMGPHRRPGLRIPAQRPCSRPLRALRGRPLPRMPAAKPAPWDGPGELGPRSAVLPGVGA
jgi:hypothetical protein